MPSDSKKTIKVGILLYADVMRSAVYGLEELFIVANRQKPASDVARWPRFVTTIVSPNVDLCSDFQSSQTILELNQTLDIILVPPAIGDRLPERIAPDLKDWLTLQYSHGCVLASACVGVFILALGGFLRERPSTTHWALGDVLSSKDKTIKLDADKILIDDGDVITAGGVMAWMDLGLHIVQRFAGPELVMKLSKFFIVDTGQREQKYYQDFSPNFSHGDRAIIRLQHWLQAHYTRATTLADMAEQSSMTERTLQRRFASATGFSPTTYLQRLRIQKAKEQLETSVKTIDQIAWQNGYEDPGVFRKRFKQWIGLSPSQYRNRFQQNT